MKSKKYILIGGCALLWPIFSACAAPTGLLDLYHQAATDDPVFKASNSAYQAGLKNRDIGLSGLLPSLSANVSETRVRENVATPASNLKQYNFTSRSKSIQLTQVIFDWEKIAAYGELSNRALQAEAVFAEAKVDLIQRVTEAYFNLLLAYDNFDLAKAQTEALKQQRVQAEKLNQSGVGTITDVEETTARHQLSEAQLLVATSALDIKRRELARIVGRVPEQLRHITGSIELAYPEPRELSSWLEIAGRQNPRVISQKLGLNVAESQLERARSGHLPSLHLIASQSQGDAPNYFSTRDDQTRVGLQMSIPLYEGGRVSSVSAQLVHLRDKAQSELESAVLDSQVKVSQAYLGVVNGIAQINALEQAVKSSETALRGMEVGQRTGFRTNTDVLNAQQQLFTAKRDLQRERYTYLLNRLQLGGVTGALTEQDIAMIDSIIGKAHPALSKIEGAVHSGKPRISSVSQKR
ncbi:MAG: TolC family outer membrane protein [Gallionella sp.]|jgi:TolC family type I secretion outer membrane protein